MKRKKKKRGKVYINMYTRINIINYYFLHYSYIHIFIYWELFQKKEHLGIDWYINISSIFRQRRENEYIKREAREREREIMLRLKKENREKSWERKSSRFSRFRDNEIYRWLDSVDVRESSSGTVSGTSNGVTVSTGGDDRVPSLFSCNFYDSLLPLPLLASHSLSLATIDINPFSLYVQEGVAWKITRVIE